MINELLKNEKIIAVGEHYLTDDGVVLIRVNGAGTAQYWVRENSLTIVYSTVADAYYEIHGKMLSRLRSGTAYNIVSSIKSYLSE